jgi:hypothetical protein
MRCYSGRAVLDIARSRGFCDSILTRFGQPANLSRSQSVSLRIGEVRSGEVRVDEVRSVAIR